MVGILHQVCKILTKSTICFKAKCIVTELKGDNTSDDSPFDVIESVVVIQQGGDHPQRWENTSV